MDINIHTAAEQRDMLKAKALKIVEGARTSVGQPVDLGWSNSRLAEAQVYATLALAAAIESHEEALFVAQASD